MELDSFYASEVGCQAVLTSLFQFCDLTGNVACLFVCLCVCVFPCGIMELRVACLSRVRVKLSNDYHFTG